MIAFKDMPVERKLTLIVMAVYGFTLLLAALTAVAIYIESGIGNPAERLKDRAVMICVIAPAVGLLAFALKLRFQRLITSPIASLGKTAGEIAARKDYSLRVGEWGGDELGRLIATFNGMMTEIQKRDNDLRRARDEFEERLAQRTAELEQEITSRKRSEEDHQNLLHKIEAANKELNDFAYVVSHDLKAPIRAISSLANWLATDCADKLDQEDKEKLALLVGRTRRMHDLVNGILEYSRIGRVKDQAVDTDLNGLLNDVVDTIAPPADIQVLIQKDLPTVRYDKTRTFQVFQNLIGNAVKYMDKQKGIIKVVCANEGSYWQFTIRDNGPGIHWKYFDKIFQLFQTLAPKDQSESTGVGLALVKKIVSTWGGRIWVESEVGVGSSFIFTLPKT